MIVLSDAENRTIVSSFVWTKHRNVTDRRTERRTDGQNRSGYYNGLHSEQCGCAIKNEAQMPKYKLQNASTRLRESVDM